MNKTIPNDAAFSRPYSRDEHSGDSPENHFAFWGLTKREYFAAMAMQGILSASHSDAESSAGFYSPQDKNIAIMSVQYADALINELNK